MLNQEESSKYIFLLLHGYATRKKKYASVKQHIKKEFPKATILFPYLGMTAWSTANPDDIAVGAINKIDEAWEVLKNEKDANVEDVKIVIIGHSTGSLLARKIYIVACGENSDAPFEETYKEQPKQRVWAKNIDRIILLAGMNRGWTLNSHIYTGTAFLMTIGMLVGHILRLCGKEPLAFRTHRGGSFITQLRLQWISMIRHTCSKGIGDANIIQLLGTIDDIIGPDDSVDIVTGANFIYREVPDSNHMTVLIMDNSKSGIVRAGVFDKALKDSTADLQKDQISPSDQTGLKEDLDVSDVVFVIHGIRDTGYWTHKIARKVKLEGDKEMIENTEVRRKYATETSSYGYFGMLPFLFPFIRRRKVEWLMDQYTENVAQYPKAEFSFMGHSNGTYLLAKALKEYPACRFKNVVFAGSVVRTNFDWMQLHNQGRVKNVFNFVASNDAIVALFPKFFQTFRIQDLGSAGYDGFNTKAGAICQSKFVNGGHGTATRELFWNEIAYIIIHGTPSQSLIDKEEPTRTFFMTCVGYIAPILFIAILILVIYSGFLIWQLVNGYTSDLTLSILSAITYIIFIWWVSTKV